MQKVKKVFEIRTTENRINQMFGSQIKGTVHLSLGQELADVSIISRHENPFVFGNHRSHGQYLAATGDIEGLIKQIINYKSQHLYFPDRFLSNGIQGGLTPVAVGLAYGYMMKGIDRKVLCFVGDGTTGQGVFYEALNLASVFRPNVTFILYDNGYSMDKTVLNKSVHEWAEGIKRAFGIHVTHAKYQPVDGPHLHVETITRLCGHSCNDTQMYRPKEERTKEWIEYHDPVHSLQKYYPELWADVYESVNKRIDAVTIKQEAEGA